MVDVKLLEERTQMLLQEKEKDMKGLVHCLCHLLTRVAQGSRTSFTPELLQPGWLMLFESVLPRRNAPV